MDQKLICDNCGRGAATVKRVTRTYGCGEDLTVIENIPIVVCRHCGESCFTAETMRELDRLKGCGNSPSKRRSVAVIGFS